MTTKEGYQPSYTWKSILSAHELILSATSLMAKMWRYGKINGYLKSLAVNQEPLNVKLKKMLWCLIWWRKTWDDGKRIWLLQSLNNMWRKWLLVCLCLIDSPLIVWFGNRKMRASVWLIQTYHFICDKFEKKQPGRPRNRTYRIWKGSWKAPIPNKIMNFICRIVKNILPTRVNLHKKGISFWRGGILISSVYAM